MTKRLINLFFVLFVSLSAVAQTAPDFTFTDVNGVEHSLYETLESGTVVFLDFFFVDCGPCNVNHPEVESLIEDYANSTVEFWAISDRDEDEYIRQSIFNSTHDNHFVGGIEGGGSDVIDLYASNFVFMGFPTYSVICVDKWISWDHWPIESGMPAIRALLTEDCGVFFQATSVQELASIESATISPNPTTGFFTFSFRLTQAEAMNITIVNPQGNIVKDLGQYRYPAGNHSMEVDISDLSRGVYFLKTETPDGAEVFRLVRQ